MSGFTHLHVHTEYSLLDGVNRTYQLFGKVKDSGMTSVAISDHGVLYGVPEFWTTSKDFSVKPILGCEMYLAPGDMKFRGEVDGIKYYHLLLIAKNLTGYKNLVKLVTDSHLKGMYFKPRVDLELLNKYKEGLICTSACLAGPISKHILNDQYEKAEWWLNQLHNIFKDDFYLEIQRNGLRQHDKIDDEKIRTYPENEWEGHFEMVKGQQKVNKKLYEYSDKYKIPIVASTDAHYLDENDKDIQKILFNIRDGKTLKDQSALNGYMETYIKTPEELYKDFGDIPEVMQETLKIDEKIEKFDITFDRVQPRFWNIKKNSSAEEQLRDDVFRGAYLKYKNERLKETDSNINDLGHKELEGLISPSLVERLNYELKVIHDKGFDDYFLVVSDIMKWAYENSILMGVRGSVAGSVSAYCLGIVGIDPIKWELYFERFLNPERPSPPDIDMDIQDSRRDEIISYVKEKYGEDSVAAICSVGRLKTKAAIRDVARVMDIDLKVADKLSKLVHVILGKHKKFKEMLEIDPEFKEIVNSDSRLSDLGNVVTKIEGLSRHMSVHACGYLITPGPIENFTALQKESKGDRIVTQWEGPWIEELGLMKFDFLGLRTLTIIAETLKLVNKNNPDLNYNNIPDKDEDTFNLFSRGETIGVFQFESPPMQKYLIDLQPTSQEDLCFMAAAYRPGPMQYIPDYIDIKRGRKQPNYLFPEIQSIVGNTNGFAIYQEQVIKIAVEYGGYSMGQADLLRRAMGKKKIKIMEQEEPIFKQGVISKGYSKEIADRLWEYMLPFADYGFNKAHAAVYATIAYKCAYLKSKYPLEFMTALMHVDLEVPDRIIVNIQEAKRLGFEILPPNINKSYVDFIPEGDKGIRFGLGAIKNVSVNVCGLIIKERDLNGDFKNLDDFINRLGAKNISRKIIECLIKVGALDEFGHRNGLLEIMPKVYNMALKNHQSHISGQEGLFGSSSEISTYKTPIPTDVSKVSDKIQLEWEKELIGMYVTSHPLANFKWIRTNPMYFNTEELLNIKVNESISIIGILTNIKTVYTKSDNNKMAIMKIEDLNGSIDAVIFPKTYIEIESKEMLKEGRPYIINGRLNLKDERKSIIVESILLAGEVFKPQKFTLDLSKLKDSLEMETIKKMFITEGNAEVEVFYGKKELDAKNRKYIQKSFKKNVDINDENTIELIRKHTKKY